MNATVVPISDAGSGPARQALEMLAVTASGMFAGTMLCIGLAFGRYWASLPPDGFVDWFAANSGFIAATIPAVALPTALGLIASLWLSRRDHGRRRWWLGALACWIAVGGVTAIYHLPTNAAIAEGRVAPADVPDVLSTWLQLHALRIGAGITGTLFACHAATTGR